MRRQSNDDHASTNAKGKRALTLCVVEQAMGSRIPRVAMRGVLVALVGDEQESRQDVGRGCWDWAD